MDYFEINQEKIFVEIKNNNVVLKKYVDDVLTELNEDEKNKILDELKGDDGYNYDSEMLVELMKSNSSLNSNFDYYYKLLSYIENIIPDKYRSNFYNNLKTLHIDLNLDAEILKSSDGSYIEVGSYDTKSNKIVFSPEAVKNLKDNSKMADDPKDFFWKIFNKNVLHELFHMASSCFDKEKQIALCGFDKCPNDNICDSNRGLTEGMTEVLACCGIPVVVNTVSYHIEVLLVNQLASIIGFKPLIDSYFGNLGNKLLCEKLCEIEDDYELASSLFSIINFNFCLHKRNEKQTFLGTAQSMLVYYYSEKVLRNIAKGVPEVEIRKSMECYKNGLITKDLLKIMRKNPSNYPNLDASIESYEKLELRVNELFNDKVK